MMERVKRFIKRTIKYISRPEMRILPGQLAFFIVVSLIPLLALVGSIAGYLSVSYDQTIKILESILPFEITEDIVTYVSGRGITFQMGVFFISAFILASNGTHSMIITSNEIYKVEDHHVIERRIKAIGMTMILVLLFLFLLIVPVFGDSIFQIITNPYNDRGAVKVIYSIYKLVQYPITFLLIFINVKALYTLAPDRKIKSKDTTTGSFITTMGWITATEIYSVYAGRFSNYNLFYGSISNFLFLLMWVYILSYIFVLGMAFNATNTEQDDYETMKLNLKNLRK